MIPSEWQQPVTAPRPIPDTPAIGPLPIPERDASAAEAQVWIADAAAAIDELRLDPIRRLLALASRVPRGPQAHAAMRAVADLLGINVGDNPVRGAVEASSAADAVKTLVVAVVGAFKAELAAEQERTRAQFAKDTATDPRRAAAVAEFECRRSQAAADAAKPQG